jgi:hypothetical protein
MLRLIHNQTVVGALIVDDIDDGLPNKEVYRLGSKSEKKSYKRDGAAGRSKQNCYVPYTRKAYGNPTVQGYINLNQTERVILSSGTGKISKLQSSGLITVTSLTAAQIAAPTVSACVHGASPVTITGTTLTSVAPDTTTVTFARGTGASTPSPAVFTAAAIIAGGGTVGATSITIPAAMFTVQATVVNNTVTVFANAQNSNTFTLT